jgi:formiminoglutamase
MTKELKYILPPSVIYRSQRKDRLESRVCNWLHPWEGERDGDVAFLGVPFSRASLSGISGAGAAPNAIRQSFLRNTTYSPDFDIDIQMLKAYDLGDVRQHVTDILGTHANIRDAVIEAYHELGEILLLIVGGDHSITCPSVEGFCSVYPERSVGIIHFDAHNDVRSLDSDGPSNGTPFRGILEGPSRIRGRNLVQIGIHGFMNSSAYKGYCDEQGITVISSRQVRKRGIESVMREALEIAKDGTNRLYVSVDIDVLSFPFAPGTAAASPEGLEPWDLLEAMFILGQEPSVLAVDLVCVDPVRDFQDYTSRMASSILLTLLAGYVVRKTGGRGYS